MRNRPLFVDDHAQLLRKCDGEKYRPSNGTEGEMFRERWCYQCKKDNFDEQTMSGGCDVLTRSLAFAVEEPEYPEEWQYNPQGQPICTAFEGGDHGKLRG